MGITKPIKIAPAISTPAIKHAKAAAKREAAQRQEEERKRLAELKAEREADEAHVQDVKDIAITALMAHAHLSVEEAQMVVGAIAKKEIPNITIIY